MEEFLILIPKHKSKGVHNNYHQLTVSRKPYDATREKEVLWCRVVYLVPLFPEHLLFGTVDPGAEAVKSDLTVLFQIRNQITEQQVNGDKMHTGCLQCVLSVGVPSD